MKLLIPLFLVQILCISFVSGQIVHQKGTPAGWNLKSSTEAIASFRLPVMNNAELIKQANDEAKTTRKPYQFAKGVETQLHPQNSGTWSELYNGDRLWRLQLESVGAVNLNVIFSEYDLKPGERVFIYSIDRTQVLGPFTYKNNKSNGSLATSLLTSDKIIVEYHVPASSLEVGRLTIGKVSHGFRGLSSQGFGESGECNNNVVCEEWTDWSCQARAIGIILVNGEGNCSGSLLNNHKQDGRAIFSTADHCTGGGTDNWVIGFDWKSSTCENPTQGPIVNNSISGVTLLASDVNSDFALLELSEVPPAEFGVYYGGWDATGDIPTEVVGIHHPSGDIMKISKDEDPAISDQDWSGVEVWTVNWDDGTTEGGSSGSALYDHNQRLIGQLLGGGAACQSQSGEANNGDSDDYGRLDASWSLGASEILDPEGTGVKVLDGIAFDGECAPSSSVPGNDAFNGQSVKDATLHVHQLSSGKKLKIDVSASTQMKLQNLNGQTVHSQYLQKGLNTLSLPKGLSGLYVMKFPEGTYANRLLTINR